MTKKTDKSYVIKKASRVNAYTNDLEAASRLDDWQNDVTLMGTRSDKRVHTRFSRNGRLDKETLRSLYETNDTVARIVDLLPDEALRTGWTLPTDTKGALAAACNELNLRSVMREAWTWSRLDGGALILIGAFDGTRMDRPLVEENLQKPTYLTVFDSHEVRVAERYSDPFLPKYGQPKLYEIIIQDPNYVGPRSTRTTTFGSGLGRLVHETRVVRFDGQISKRQTRREEGNGFGPGIIDRLYPIIRDYESAFSNMATLMHDFAQGVLKMRGLANMAAKQGSDQLLAQRLAKMDFSRSSMRSMLVDADYEDFTRIGTPVSGLSDLLDKMVMRLCTGAGYPITLFTGQSPGGLGSSGSGEAENAYNAVKAAQTTHLNQPLGYLLRVIAKGNGLDEVLDEHEQVPFEHKPLWQASELEQAQARSADASADDLRIKDGVLTPIEVAKSRYGTGRYSSEIKLDTLTQPREIYEPPQPDPAPVAKTSKPSSKA